LVDWLFGFSRKKAVQHIVTLATIDNDSQHDAVNECSWCIWA